MGQAAANHDEVMDELREQGQRAKDIMDVLERLDGRHKSARQLQKEATARKQKEKQLRARDRLHALLRLVGRAPPEETLQSLAMYEERLREPALQEAAAQKQKHEKSVNELKRKRQAELQALCDELNVERDAKMSKQQMAERIVEKRAAAAPVNVGAAAALPDGAKYTGGRDENGRYHGMGKLSTTDATYTGQFQHGLKHGKGKLETNGAVYIGEFADDQKHGFGVLTDANGRVEAKWVEGRIQGQGVVTYPDGVEYKGDLNEDGDLEGHGEITNPEGTGTGLWRDGQLVKGISADAAATFKGTFDDGRLHGCGQQVADGKVVQGLFEHGTLVAAA